MPEIVSSPSENDPRPWFDFEIMDGMKVRFNAANGLGAFSDGDPSDLAHLLGSRTLALSSEQPEAVHALAVATDGSLDFVPRDQQRETYYAHLAWYDPAADEWDRLRFVEP